MIWLASSVCVLAPACIFLSYELLRLELRHRELLRNYVDMLTDYQTLRGVVDFYTHVEKSTLNPKFTGEVAQKALKKELH